MRSDRVFISFLEFEVSFQPASSAYVSLGITGLIKDAVDLVSFGHVSTHSLSQRSAPRT